MDELAAEKDGAKSRKEKDRIQKLIDSERNRYSATLQRRKKDEFLSDLENQAKEGKKLKELFTKLRDAIKTSKTDTLML